MSRQLAELLLKDKIISANQFSESQQQSASGVDQAKYLIDKKYVSETKLLYYLSQKFGLPTINLAKFEVNADVIKLVPPDIARKHQVVPIQANKGTVVVAICDPASLSAMDELKFIMKMNVEAVLTSFSAFEQAVGKYYTGAAAAGFAVEAYQKEQKKEARKGGAAEGTGINIELVQMHNIDQGGADQDAPVITLVNSLLAEGIRRGASDIHVEPYEKRFRVRMRVDGVLLEVLQIPLEMKRACIARFKIMSRLDIAETRVPQDGRIKLKLNGVEVDFRVNTMPTLFGEKVVLRMLSKGNLKLDLAKLGFEQKQMEVFRKGIESPNGMVLVTGPTGSGKTTTLYSALFELNKISENLSTAEDPVEYNLEGINQVQVNKDVGLTFASVLRALLRQDPDVILVGEIRDYETAEVAVQAALTGHLVLSTLHTNDAPSTITRLVNMGLEPFLVVASLNAILAQRLLRTICSKCKVEIPVERERLIKLGMREEDVARAKNFKGNGCENCNGTGYRGRIAIYEVLDFSSNLKEMVLRGESVIEIRKQAIKEGMKTLRQSGLTKAAEGFTTLEEALTSTMES